MNWVQEALGKSLAKVERNIDLIGEHFPHVSLDGSYNDEGPHFWTSGFWPGILWIDYEEHGNEKARDLAIQLETLLDEPLNHFLTLHHDVGFMWLPSAVEHYRWDYNEESRTRGLKAASHLAGRYNLAGAFIRAWTDEVNPDSVGWAIIDCLMNLPLLFWASKELRDPRFKQIAMAHADTVLREFLRTDNTVPHIVCFDPDTGMKIENLGGQGMGPDSVWSRGQAWAIYGLAIAYRETGKKEYLNASQNITNYFLSHLPEDKAAYWDFKSPEVECHVKDTSASACAASGILELCKYLEDPVEQNFYWNAAEGILKGLYENYSCFTEENQGILMDGTVSYPNRKHINVPIIYGDFFFVEGLRKLCGGNGVF